MEKSNDIAVKESSNHLFAIINADVNKIPFI